MQRAASLPAILAALLLACPAPALAGQCSAKGHRLWGKVKVVNADITDSANYFFHKNVLLNHTKIRKKCVHCGKL